MFQPREPRYNRQSSYTDLSRFGARFVQVSTAAPRVESMKLLNARSTFIVLQVLDLLTTLVAFRVGAFEINPLVAHLALLLGPAWGVLCSKVVAVVIAFRVRRLISVVNVFYTAVIFWNLIVLVSLSVRHH